MSATRPKLPSLKTPTTATFPSDALLSASSIRTPHSAASFKGPLSAAALYSAGLPSAGLPSAPLDYPPTPSMLSARLEDTFKPAEKTPITPPLAYMDFLKSINPASPSMASPPLTAPLPSKSPLKRTSTGDSVETVQTIKTEDTADSATEDDLDSVPTSATTTSDATDCSCHGEHSEKASRPAPISIKHTKPLSSSSTAAVLPLSAPATGPTTFPSLRVPQSPAVESPMRSPWSARSLKSPFDWDAALKAKRYTEIPTAPTSAGPTSAGPPSARGDKKATSVRHIREVVTRTVTYTPRMEPAPRGKRRKLNDTSAE